MKRAREKAPPFEPKVRRATLPLQMFRSPTLKQPDHLHRRECRGGLEADGSRRDDRCSCLEGRDKILPDTHVLVTAEQDGASLVVVGTSTCPTWVETAGLGDPKNEEETRSTLERTSRPSRRPQNVEYPDDFTELVKLKNDVGKIEWPKRRRIPRGGELVFVREEMGKDKNPVPWRLACTVMVDGARPRIVLVDPRLPLAASWTPGWDDVRYVDGKVEAALYPITPLPEVKAKRR